MADTLDQDVHALKEWLRGAWRQLADPSMTRFGRRELRNYMREAEAALRAGLNQLAAKENARHKAYADRPFTRPDFRALKIVTLTEALCYGQNKVAGNLWTDHPADRRV